MFDELPDRFRSGQGLVLGIAIDPHARLRNLLRSRMWAMRLGHILFLVLSATTFTATSARAEVCDQFHTYPNQPGPGPIYEGTSKMPDPKDEPRAILQWECFFVNPSHVLSVDAVLFDSAGNSVPYVQYDITFNRKYYPGQTAIKVNFQRLPTNAKIEKNLHVQYKITFEQD
jgi:hypothetical protein